MDPVQLEVVRHALQGVAEEMGWRCGARRTPPTSRSARTARRRCSTPTGDGGPGRAHPRAPRIDAGQRRRRPRRPSADPGARGRRSRSTTRTPGGRTCPTSPSSPRWPTTTGAARLRREPGAPRRRRRRRTRLHAGRAVDIAMEGLRIPPTDRRDREGVREDVLELIAANSRTPWERRGDLRAQFAANHVGARASASWPTHGTRAAGGGDDRGPRLQRPAGARGGGGSPTGPTASPTSSRSATRAAMRRSASPSPSTASRCWRLRRHRPRRSPVGCNAVLAVTLSSAYFVFRMLTDPDAPPNEGCYRPARCARRRAAS
jgi:hypothetical protein